MPIHTFATSPAINGKTEKDNRKYKIFTKGMQLKPKLWYSHKMKLRIELHEKRKKKFLYLKLFIYKCARDRDALQRML